MHTADDSPPPLRATLHHLAIASERPAALADFYAVALGMELSPQTHGILARGPSRSIVFVEGPAKSLGFAAYAVAKPAELVGLRRRCATHAVTVDECADPLFEDGAIRVVDPDGNSMVFGVARPDAAPAHGLPARLQHVVVASTDAGRLSAFYQSVFGFVLSDNVLDAEGGLRTAFLRCSEEHHSFAVFAAERCWFDHHCYEAGDWGLIRDWGDRFAAHHIPVQWGPGRHGPGNNLFLFVHDLDGNWLEISAELERVPPERPVGVWKHEQRTLNSWGSAPLRS